MDEKKLRGFVGIFEHKSMTRAAEKLYTTPPALMRQLDALEDELGASLFLRSPAGCIPTQAGELLYQRIKPVLNEMQVIRTQITALGREKHRIAICTSMHASLPLLDAYCEHLIHAYSDVQIEYISSIPSEWISLVNSGKADCCLVSDSFIDASASHHLAYTEIGFRPIICIMSSSHPLSSHSNLTAEDLVDKSICIDIPTLYTVESALQNMKITYKLLKDEQSPSELFNLCRKEYIYVTSSPYGIQFPSLVSIPIDLPPMRVGWLTRKKQSDLLKALLRISAEQNKYI